MIDLDEVRLPEIDDFKSRTYYNIKNNSPYKEFITNSKESDIIKLLISIYSLLTKINLEEIIKKSGYDEVINTLKRINFDDYNIELLDKIFTNFYTNNQLKGKTSVK